MDDKLYYRIVHLRHPNGQHQYFGMAWTPNDTKAWCGTHELTYGLAREGLVCVLEADGLNSESLCYFDGEWHASDH